MKEMGRRSMKASAYDVRMLKHCAYIHVHRALTLHTHARLALTHICLCCTPGFMLVVCISLWPIVQLPLSIVLWPIWSRDSARAKLAASLDTMATVCETYDPEKSDPEVVLTTLKGVATKLESLYAEFDLCWCVLLHSFLFAGLAWALLSHLAEAICILPHDLPLF